jgi:hypothetical protein
VGGALYLSGGTATLSSSTVNADVVGGGQGGNGGHGGAVLGNLAGGAGGVGGDGGAGRGGGCAVPAGILTFSNATIASNDTFGGDGGQGGDGGSGNPSGPGGNGGDGGTEKGGGLFVFGSGTADVHNSTFAVNYSGSSHGGAPGAGGAQGQDVPGQAGGVRRDSGTVNAVSSIFANNYVATGGTDPDFSGNFASAQHNLLRDNTGSNLAAANPDANGNKVGTQGSPIDPKFVLQQLDNYGGPTKTLALRPDSPAIDAGSNPDGLMSDQRGFLSRAINGATDIGAFEFGAVDPASDPSSGGNGGGGSGQPVFHKLVTKMTRIKGRTRLDVFDAATMAKKGSVFPFGKFRGKLMVVQVDFNGDGFTDLLVLAVQGGRLRQRTYSGVDLSILV